MCDPPWACLRKKDLGWDRGVESKKVVQHVYLVGAKSIYRVAEKDEEYLRDEEEKNQNTAFGGSDISKLLDLPTFYFMFAVIILECKENRLKGNFYKHLRSTSETMYFIHMYFVAFCALVLYKDDYNNFKSYLICAGGALAVSEIYSWMKNISNRSTTVSRLKHD